MSSIIGRLGEFLLSFRMLLKSLISSGVKNPPLRKKFLIVVVSGGTESNCHCLFRVYVFSSSFVDFTIFRSLTGTVLRICISSALTSALLLLKAGFSTKSNIPPVSITDEKNFDAQCDLADFCNLLNMVMKLGIKLFCIIVNSHPGANILYLFLYFCQIFLSNI